MNNQSLTQRAEQALLNYLGDVPFLRVEKPRRLAIHSKPGPEFALRLRLPKGEQLLVAEVKSAGQPKPAREAVNQIHRYLQALPDAYGVFMAPYISPQAAAICVDEGVGYADLAGNCRLAFQSVYIHREGRPNPFIRRRALRSLYSPKAARVLRVLLVHAGQKRKWKLSELAQEAGVSLGQVSNVKKLLVDREWVRSETGGLMLTASGALLDEWAENYSFRRNLAHDYYSLQSAGQIELELARLCRREQIPYALTAFSGAARLAPAVRYQRVMAYVQGDIAALAERAKLKPVESGANVTLLEPYDDGVFYDAQQVDAINIVTPVQLYLDLKGFRGRGDEAAAMLREQVIEPAWQ